MSDTPKPPAVTDDDYRFALMQVYVRQIPELEGDEWIAWCEENGISPMTERGWSSDIKAYVYPGHYMVYVDGEFVCTAMECELDF